MIKVSGLTFGGAIQRPGRAQSSQSACSSSALRLARSTTRDRRTRCTHLCTGCWTCSASTPVLWSAPRPTRPSKNTSQPCLPKPSSHGGEDEAESSETVARGAWWRASKRRAENRDGFGGGEIGPNHTEYPERTTEVPTQRKAVRSVFRARHGRAGHPCGTPVQSAFLQRTSCLPSGRERPFAIGKTTTALPKAILSKQHAYTVQESHHPHTIWQIK